MCNRGTASQMWLVEKHHSAYIVSCCSGRQFLSHGSGRLFLQNGYRGAGELWEFFPFGVAGMPMVVCQKYTNLIMRG